MVYNFEFLNISVNVQISSPIVIEFLEAYFAPFFVVKEGRVEAALADIDLVVQNDFSANNVEGAETLLVDGSKGFLATTALLIHKAPVRELVLLPMQTFVQIDRRNKSIRVTAQTAHRAKVPMLRIIEDLIQVEAEKKGGVFIHCSGLATEQSGVIAVGEKHAGKTSFLCYGLQSFSCQKLTNDSALLFLKDGEVYVRGWPSFFKVELGTIAHCDPLVPYFPANQTMLLQSSVDLWDSRVDKLPLYPRQAAAIFQKKIIPEAKLDCIIFPQFSRQNIQHRKIDIGKVELQSILIRNLQGSFNSKHPNWHSFNEVSEQFILKSLEKLVSIMDRRVSFHAIQWAPSYSQLMSEVDGLKRHYENFHKAGNVMNRDLDAWPELPPVF